MVQSMNGIPYKYYINIYRTDSDEETRELKAFVQPFVDANEIGLNGYYKYITENDTHIHGPGRCHFFFRNTEVALRFLRTLPEKFWIYPMLGLNKEGEYIQGYQELQTKIMFNPEYLKWFNEKIQNGEVKW